MFHAFDNTGPNRPTPRPAWMALLSRAPLPLLEQALSQQSGAPLQWLRKPETGLYMVQGRAGGTGERFNLGEMTVTRCALRVGGEGSAVGVAYVMGRNHRHAQLAAMADALLQDPTQHDRIDDTVLQPVRQHLAQQQAQRAARAQSTQVNFFTVAREAGTPDEGDEA
jgi:alpha-D-ribose 1-methylphosphonate 5-triphosphate synthase subunit PhnG